MLSLVVSQAGCLDFLSGEDKHWFKSINEAPGGAQTSVILDHLILTAMPIPNTYFGAPLKPLSRDLRKVSFMGICLTFFLPSSLLSHFCFINGQTISPAAQYQKNSTTAHNIPSPTSHTAESLDTL